ncbi:MAG: hypothetical protein LLG06_17010 [Desulfobacteraceae bacterium]|nr:hypothetical protein [Desulfobacteraceae bacterium]
MTESEQLPATGAATAGLSFLSPGRRGAHSPKTLWRQRRVRLLHKACLAVVKLSEKGYQVTRAFRRVSRRFNGRHLGEGRSLDCSSWTLMRLYYRWRKANQDPAVFELHFNGSGIKKVSSAHVHRIVLMALSSNVCLAKSFRAVGGKEKLGFTCSSLYRHVDARFKRFARIHENISGRKIRLLSELNEVATKGEIK